MGRGRKRPPWKGCQCQHVSSGPAQSPLPQPELCSPDEEVEAERLQSRPPSQHCPCDPGPRPPHPFPARPGPEGQEG